VSRGDASNETDARPDRLCGATDWKHRCPLPKGHHGRHCCSSDDGHTWPNENETRPCPSTEVAVLGALNGPARVRCGLLYDHNGNHRFAIEWAAAVVDGTEARIAESEAAIDRGDLGESTTVESLRRVADGTGEPT
jgi:hypothetical protein